MSRNKRCRPSNEPDALILIPKDRAGGSYPQRVRRAVRWLWSRGIYPGPDAVSLRMHGHTRSSHSLNGRETTIRNNMMVELGITRQRNYANDPARMTELSRGPR